MASTPKHCTSECKRWSRRSVWRCWRSLCTWEQANVAPACLSIPRYVCCCWHAFVVCVCGIISPSSLLDGRDQAGDFWQADHIVPVAEGRLQCELVAGVLCSSLTHVTPYVLCEQVEASVGCSTIAHSALLATPRKQQLCDAASAYNQVAQRTFAASLAPAKLRGMYDTVSLHHSVLSRRIALA